MASILQFANNAASTLAGAINPASLTLTIQPGSGSLFPSITGDQIFKVTLTDAATGGIREIVNVTARAGDTFTIVRGQEGTTAGSWLPGDFVEMLPTKETMTAFSQVTQTQAGSPNYAADTGSTNSYLAALAPPVTGRVPGLVARIKAANANTGPSTLDIGAGPISLVNPDGSALSSGAVVINGVFEAIDTGSGPYQLISASQEAQSGAGLATTGDFKPRPTSEAIPGWVIANATTIGNAVSGASQRANPDTVNLFAWHWNNFSNTQCPVFTSGGVLTSRGANAAADYAANKSIQVYDKRGKGWIGVDGMGGAASAFLSGVPVTSGSSTVPGSVLGENLHALLTAELAAHAHASTLTDPGHTHANTLSDPGHVHSNSLTDPGHSHSSTITDPGHTHANSLVDPGHTHVNTLTDLGHTHASTLSDPGHVHANTLSDPGHTHGVSGDPNAIMGLANSVPGALDFANGSKASRLVTSAIVLGTSTTSVTVNNASAGTGLSINNAAHAANLTLTNTAQVTGMSITNASHTAGLTLNNASAGTGMGITNASQSTGVSINNASRVTGITLNNASTGSGTGHNNVELSDACYWHIKL